MLEEETPETDHRPSDRKTESLSQRKHEHEHDAGCQPSLKIRTKSKVKKYIQVHDEPPIVPRSSSKKARKVSKISIPKSNEEGQARDFAYTVTEPDPETDPLEMKELSKETPRSQLSLEPDHEEHFSQIFGLPSQESSGNHSHDRQHISFESEGDFAQKTTVNLKGARHIDLKGVSDVEIHCFCHHQPIARDWPKSRKRFTSWVVCINAATIGIVIGIYSGEVPAIQYVIIDENHYTILGNVFLYLGLLVPTLILWPLPLLHGRKPYTVLALLAALVLQVPQAIAVSTYNSPSVRSFRAVLLLTRGLSGFALGFANINIQQTLLDLFGSSLQSSNPHQEIVNLADVRRHGGGMGVWLGILTCSNLASISIGFFIGACIIQSDVAWGFWASLLLLMFVLGLNVIAPEPRRAAYRRTVMEFQGARGDFSRVARGEIKMHLKLAGPYWWGEEIKAGLELCWLMLKQPGFLILAFYVAWIYAQFTMAIMVRNHSDYPLYLLTVAPTASRRSQLTRISATLTSSRLLYILFGAWGHRRDTFRQGVIVQSSQDASTKNEFADA